MGDNAACNRVRGAHGRALGTRYQALVNQRRMYPNPSVRPSWRRLATQRRIEPSEFSIFGIERPPQVDHGHLGSRRTTIHRSAFQKALCKSVDKMLLKV